ncbi:MAG: hypothetical protein AAGA69_01675 [Pseudomonadota bacterium]
MVGFSKSFDTISFEFNSSPEIDLDVDIDVDIDVELVLDPQQDYNLADVSGFTTFSDSSISFGEGTASASIYGSVSGSVFSSISGSASAYVADDGSSGASATVSGTGENVVVEASTSAGSVLDLDLSLPVIEVDFTDFSFG